MRTVKPTHDMILVEELKDDARKASPLHLSPALRAQKKEEETMRNEFYRVLAVGPGGVTEYGSLVPMCCKPGDTVVIAGNLDKLYVDGKFYYVTRNLYVRAVIEGEADPADDAIAQQPVVLQ